MAGQSLLGRSSGVVPNPHLPGYMFVTDEFSLPGQSNLQMFLMNVMSPTLGEFKTIFVIRGFILFTGGFGLNLILQKHLIL